MEQMLDKVFENINNWLRFAEAKNGILISINAGMIFAFHSTFYSQLVEKSTSVFTKGYYWQFILMTMLSLVTCLISFFPQKNNHIAQSKNLIKSTHDNLFYFEHILKYTAEEYLIALNERECKEFSKTESYYANQIIANSKITARKLRCFKIALFFTLSAIITLLGSIIVYEIFNLGEEELSNY